MKTNYHIHTFRCGHAIGDIEDYVKQAVSEGFTQIGFADHTPLPDDWWPEIRMRMSQLTDYLDKIDAANRTFKNIEILKGLECDYFSRYDSFFVEELLGDYDLDYLVGSVHAYEYNGIMYDAYHSDMKGERMVSYAKQYVQAMECGAFAFMAHPDLYCFKVNKWNEDAKNCAKEILQAAEELDVPLEINTSGFLKKKLGHVMYPRKEFWELASAYNIRVYVNTDAHKPELVAAHYDDGIKMVRKLGMRDRKSVV